MQTLIDPKTKKAAQMIDLKDVFNEDLIIFDEHQEFIDELLK